MDYLPQDYDFLDSPYINPLKCDTSFLQCKPFVYYEIGITILILLIAVMLSNNISPISVIPSVMCIGLIFVVSSIALLNGCMEKWSNIYMYSIIAGGCLMIVCLAMFFKKNENDKKK